jgi:serine protease Do
MNKLKQLIFIILLCSCISACEPANGVTTTYKETVNKVSAAVVNIFTQKVIQQHARSPFANDPFFSKFFGGAINTPMRNRISRSLGSGVIINSEKKWVLTNHHVVKNATSIRIVLNDRREFAAKVAFDDAKLDLALLEVQTQEILPEITLGYDRDSHVGDIVLAVGNPFGLGQTVTSGIISALTRSSENLSQSTYYIQTDAAINPGNSGGALVTVSGELIGIPTAIFSKSGGSVGIGFAIPAQVVKNFLNRYGANYNKPWLGVATSDINYTIAEAAGLNGVYGVIIDAIHIKSPLYKVGVKNGDILTHFNNVKLNTLTELTVALQTVQAGANINITYWNDGKAYSKNITMIEAPEVPARELTTFRRGLLSGITVSNINPAVRQELALDLSEKGVIVSKSIGGQAYTKLQPRDIVVSINGNTIDNVDTLEKVLSKNYRGWQMIVKRNGKTIRFMYR